MSITIHGQLEKDMLNKLKTIDNHILVHQLAELEKQLEKIINDGIPALYKQKLSSFLKSAQVQQKLISPQQYSLIEQVIKLVKSEEMCFTIFYPILQAFRQQSNTQCSPHKTPYTAQHTIQEFKQFQKQHPAKLSPNKINLSQKSKNNTSSIKSTQIEKENQDLEKKQKDERKNKINALVQKQKELSQKKHATHEPIINSQYMSPAEIVENNFKLRDKYYEIEMDVEEQSYSKQPDPYKYRNQYIDGKLSAQKNKGYNEQYFEPPIQDSQELHKYKINTITRHTSSPKPQTPAKYSYQQNKQQMTQTPKNKVIQQNIQYLQEPLPIQSLQKSLQPPVLQKQQIQEQIENQIIQIFCPTPQEEQIDMQLNEIAASITNGIATEQLDSNQLISTNVQQFNIPYPSQNSILLSQQINNTSDNLLGTQYESKEEIIKVFNKVVSDLNDKLNNSLIETIVKSNIDNQKKFIALEVLNSKYETLMIKYDYLVQRMIFITGLFTTSETLTKNIVLYNQKLAYLKYYVELLKFKKYHIYLIQKKKYYQDMLDFQQNEYIRIKNYKELQIRSQEWEVKKQTLRLKKLLWAAMRVAKDGIQQIHLNVDYSQQ